MIVVCDLYTSILYSGLHCTKFQSYEIANILTTVILLMNSFEGFENLLEMTERDAKAAFNIIMKPFVQYKIYYI